MKKIPLDKGLSAKVDDADYLLLQRHAWYAHPHHSGTFYAYRATTAEERRLGLTTKKFVTMHTQIKGTSPGFLVDHRNRNPLDNRRNNLRFATRSQNRANGKRRKTASGYKGVYRGKQKIKPFQAVIIVAQQRIFMGYFASPVEAARAYDAAAVKYFGEFAVLNGV